MLAPKSLFTVVAEDSQTDLDALRTRIDRALGEPLDDRWDEVLDEWSGSERAQRQAVRDEVTALRNRLRETLTEFDSLDRLQRAIAVAYAEVKCRWTLLTVQIRDRTDRDGRVDDRLIHRATCVSLLVQQLDPLVRAADRPEVSAFVGEPLE